MVNETGRIQVYRDLRVPYVGLNFECLSPDCTYSEYCPFRASIIIGMDGLSTKQKECVYYNPEMKTQW